MLKKTLSLMLLFISTVAWGQNITEDTISIETIDVKTNMQLKNESNLGARTSVIGDAVLRATQTQSLAELLGENSLAYIKNMGQGALATMSLRGTSPYHAQVNWNGIPINSPMLGYFDFSQMPAMFTDEVTLYHGSSYLKGGAGALGGSVNLNNSYDKRSRMSEFKFLSEYGSNATFTEAASARFSTSRLTSSTRLFYQQSKNNFKFLNKILRKDEFYERRKNSEYRKAGVMQQLFYDLPKDGLLSANLWYECDDRNLPQPIMSFTSSHERQRADNLRSYVRYSRERAAHSFSVTAAYLMDRLDYSRRMDYSLGDMDTKNVCHSTLLKSDYTYNISPEVELNASVNYRFDKVVSDSYDDGKNSRHSASAQASLIWRPVERLTIHSQIMSEVNAGRYVPTYSVGGSYQLIDKLLSVKASNAYNYRYPTLNDLYWNPGGNENLRPERGFSYDATVSLTPRIAAVKLRFEGTYYNMDISDWIMWIPTSNGYIWVPVNYKRVLSHGVEMLAEASFRSGQVFHKITFNYAYSPSEDRSSKDSRAYGSQLPYVPLNHWNGRYMLNFSSLSFYYSISFTDVRYTSTDKSYSTTAYTTHDAELDYTLKIGKRCKMKLSLRVDNITNAYYESTQYYPMPLRNYYTSVMLNF